MHKLKRRASSYAYKIITIGIGMEMRGRTGALQVRLPMRSNERLAQRIAQEILPKYKASSLLDIGCGDGIVNEYLPKGCRYLGLDIKDACIYEQRHDNPNVKYVVSSQIPQLMGDLGPWEIILLLDVIEHTREFTKLFELALQQSTKSVVVSLPNELFIYDRIKMLLGYELNAHSLDHINSPEGFKHQYIINIQKAKNILSRVAADHNFMLSMEVQRPLIPKNIFLRPALWGLQVLSSENVWSMGTVFVFTPTIYENNIESAIK